MEQKVSQRQDSPFWLCSEAPGRKGVGIGVHVLNFPPVSQKPLHQIRRGDTGKETKKSTKEKRLCSLSAEGSDRRGSFLVLR